VEKQQEQLEAFLVRLTTLDHATAKRSFCVSVCLSGHLSRLWATPKRFNISKYFYTVR